MTQSGAESSPGQGRQPNVEHPWYAVRVKPRFERVVCQNLAAKGFVSFLPTYKERRRWSDRVRLVELPLFPGYVF